ncbi:hypothetical protein BE964_18980 [Escherichia coli]|uniref:Uncharacterized protein n=7 Tax=Enterobacteriaceae TaxID=543 RepID=A0A7Z1EKR6_SHIFL|nr:hypothetical protein BE964_18980 [Escherichia coli]PAY85455.1 hypothetical protein CEG97_17685 [Shigella flexneri]AQV48928.1 hypothetical protein BE966_25935 [Escherichia coli]AQV57819.1 hypothetical protein BE941_15980 [Escherichia coli]AQV64659.1 hypothetical protein BE928_23690 [Escherichia coli]
MVKEFVAIYNHERSHLALKYKTPDEVHQPFYGQKTVNLYQEQLKPGAYFHERRSLNNSPISFTVIRTRHVDERRLCCSCGRGS